MEEKNSYTYTEEYNGEKVTDDPNLTSYEREVFLRIDLNNEEVKVESDKGIIIRKLLAHKKADILELRRLNGKIVGGSFRLPLSYIELLRKS